jgi:predicted aspartyl protease
MSRHGQSLGYITKQRIITVTLPGGTMMSAHRHWAAAPPQLFMHSAILWRGPGRVLSLAARIGLGALGAALSLGYSTSTPADCKIERVAEMSVSVVNNRALLKGKINGQPVDIIVDTGSNDSVILRGEIKRLGLGTTPVHGVKSYGIGGTSAVEITKVKELVVDNYTGNDVQLLVTGERAIAPGQPSMFLGENFWAQFSVEFDFPHNALRLFQVKDCKPEQLVYWAPTFSLAELERPAKGAYRLDTLVLLNGVRVPAMLDTGTYPSVVSTDAAARANVRPDSPGVVAGRPFSGIGRYNVPTWIGKFDSFALGDEQIKNAKLTFGDVFGKATYTQLGTRIETKVPSESMILGADFFLSHRVFVPDSERFIVFTYVGGPVFHTNPASAPPPSTRPPSDSMPPQPTAGGPP